MWLEQLHPCVVCCWAWLSALSQSNGTTLRFSRITNKYLEVADAKKRQFSRAERLQEISSDCVHLQKTDEREITTWLFGPCKKCNGMKQGVEEVAALQFGEQHDRQQPGVSCCPFGAAVMATDSKALALLLVVAEECHKRYNLSVVWASFDLSWWKSC